MDKENFSCGTDCTACGGDTQGCTDALIERAEKAETERDRLTAEVERLTEQGEELAEFNINTRLKLYEEIDALKAERDKYKTALESIENESGSSGGNMWKIHGIASDALA